MAVHRRGDDPFIDLAEELRRSMFHRTSGEGGGGPLIRQEMRSALSRLCALLSDTDGASDQRASATALLLASMPPALRDEMHDELCELVGILPPESLARVMDSPSPHLRAGARMMARLTGALQPQRSPAPRPAFPVLRSPAGDVPPAASGTAGNDDRPELFPADGSVIDALCDPDAAVRHEGALRAGSRPLDARTFDALLRLIVDDPSPDVRLAAVNAFRGQGADARAAAAEHAWFSTDPDVRAAAVDLVDGGTPSEIVAGYRYLYSLDAATAARALGIVSSASPAVAVAVLWDAAPHVTERMQRDIFARLRQLDASALEVLAQAALAGEDDARRAAALVALSELDVDFLDDLLDALADPAPAIRRAALRSLGRRWDRRAFEAVAACRHDPRPDVRAWVVGLLYAAKDDRALPYLLAAAGDPVEDVRRRARDAIRSMASGDAIDWIIRQVETSESASTAEAVLADMGDAVVPRIIALLDELGERGIERAACVLRTVRAGAHVRAALRAREPAQRRRAARALVLMREAEAVPSLLQLFEDPDPDVRMTSVELIAEVGDATALDALALLHVRDPDPAVVRAVEDALGHLRVREVVHADHPAAEGGSA